MEAPRARFGVRARAGASRTLVLLAMAGTLWWGEASAQPALPAAAAALRAGDPAELRSGHGWLVVPTGLDRDLALLNIPPRDDVLSGAGTVRLANVLVNRPVAMAAFGDQVFMVFPRDRGSGADGSAVQQRRVASLTASRSLGGTWEYLPSGRTESLAALPGDGQLMGFAACKDGLLALLGPTGARGGYAAPGNDPPAPPDAPWRLFVLDADGWRRAALPRPLVDAADRNGASAQPVVRLLGSGGGSDFAMVIHPAGVPEAELWTGQTKRAAADADAPSPAPLGIEWSPSAVRRFALPRLDGTSVPLESLRAEFVDDRLVLWSRGGSSTGVSLWTAVGEKSSLLAEVGNAPPELGVVPINGLSRVALIWPETGSPVESRSEGEAASLAAVATRGYVVREVSTIDGATLYSGPARRDGPISLRDFHLLSVAFGALMAAVLLFVLRSENTSRVILPAGASLAPPGRRLAAVLLDAVPALLLATNIYGVSVGSVLSPAVLVSPGAAVGPLLLTLALCALHTCLCEGLWGQSFGKMLVGVEVAGFRRAGSSAKGLGPEGGSHGAAHEASTKNVGAYEVGAPSMLQAVIRSVVKWGLPPLNVLVMFDANFRHPADMLARTVVVVRDDEEVEEGE